MKKVILPAFDGEIDEVDSLEQNALETVTDLPTIRAEPAVAVAVVTAPWPVEIYSTLSFKFPLSPNLPVDLPVRPNVSRPLARRNIAHQLMTRRIGRAAERFLEDQDTRQLRTIDVGVSRELFDYGGSGSERVPSEIIKPVERQVRYKIARALKSLFKQLKPLSNRPAHDDE